MGLNLATQSGDFDPYVKYNAKAGRWYVKDGEQEKEVQNPVFVADFEGIKTGWLYFREGSAPEKVFDPSLTQEAPKPDKTYVDDKGNTRDCFRRGFEVRLFSKSSFGGVVVLNGASMHLNNAIGALYDQYEAGKASNPGALPVIKFVGSTPMKDKMGTNYRPDFVVDKWVPRPAEFDASAAPVTQAAPQPAPAAPTTGVSEF